MPISGLEDLLPPTASSGRGGAKAAGGWEHRLASLRHPAPPCNFGSALGAPSQGAGRSPMKAGLGVASWPLQLTCLWLHPGGSCGWNMSPSPANGEAKLDPRPGVVLATRRGGPAQGWALLHEAPGGQLGCWTECDLWPLRGHVIGLGCS